MNSRTLIIGYWSAALTALLVLLIDAGMILSTILFPMTAITNVENYAASFTSWQMLPFIPSLCLAPIFVILVLCIHRCTDEERKIFSQLGLSFGVICAAILSIHYYIQLTVVQQGLLNNETNGLWLLAAPNPHSFFWTFAALGYGFMGFALLSVSPIFVKKDQSKIKFLLLANGIIGVAFLVGNSLGFFILNILASFTWGVLFPITCIFIAKNFRLLQKKSPWVRGGCPLGRCSSLPE